MSQNIYKYPNMLYEMLKVEEKYVQCVCIKYDYTLWMSETYSLSF